MWGLVVMGLVAIAGFGLLAFTGVLESKGSKSKMIKLDIEKVLGWDYSSIYVSTDAIKVLRGRWLITLPEDGGEEIVAAAYKLTAESAERLRAFLEREGNFLDFSQGETRN